jgi:NAD+ synthase (glutamine-hydrolysing)
MNKILRIAAAQINTLVGDIAGNSAKIIQYALRAREELHADIIVFPELTITGYPPEDLLLRSELYKRVNQALALIKKEVKGIHILLGFPEQIANKSYNSAAVIYNGKTLATYRKHELPNYGVFDEKRYFYPGTQPSMFTLKKTKIAIAVCEDLWFPETMRQSKKNGAHLILSLNASPFDLNKPQLREQVLRKRVKENKIPIVYVNAVGGQDELIFDGGSMVMDATGKITQRAAFFQEELMTIDFATAKKITPTKTNIAPIGSLEERAYKALVLGIRDYLTKNHFKGAIIGISGGVDSALTAAIAVDALGKDRVTMLYMPSRYTAPLSKKIVQDLATKLGVKLSTIAIEPIFAAFLQSLKNEFGSLPPDVTEENLQARCRGTLLMAVSNKKGLIVLSTGNKSENAVGYATLYGDMAGGFCVLKDVPKTLVYKLCAYRNSISPVISPEVITRPPSAELAPNQKDTDSLPPYATLDAILELYIEKDFSADKIVALGFERATVEKVIRMVTHNEYKRRQAPPGVRITLRAFGRDRRYPITSGF